MSEPQEIRFSELVSRRLVPEGEEVRSLWAPIAQEFDRGGPESAKAWLDAEQQSLKERVERRCNLVEGGQG